MEKPPQTTPSWNCRTGENSSVTLDLKSAGKISILEQSRVNLQFPKAIRCVTLLGGSLHLSGSEGNRLRDTDVGWDLSARVG